jgi:hypothetical protein
VVGGDVLHDDGFIAKRRRTARAHVRANLETVDALHKVRGQGRRRPEQQVPPIVVEQENRAEAPWRHSLDRDSERIQDFLEGGALGHQFQDPALLVQHPPGLFQLLLILAAFGQTPARAQPSRGAGHRRYRERTSDQLKPHGCPPSRTYWKV